MLPRANNNSNSNDNNSNNNCERRLFLLHRDTTIYIYIKLRLPPIFWVRITCFSFSLSLSFSMWILYAGVSKTQEDTLQVFIIKNRICKDNWG